MTCRHLRTNLQRTDENPHCQQLRRRSSRALHVLHLFVIVVVVVVLALAGPKEHGGGLFAEGFALVSRGPPARQTKLSPPSSSIFRSTAGVTSSSVLDGVTSATSSSSSSAAADNDSSSSFSASVYNYPALYDAAFGYRDFENEVAFLLQVHDLAQGNKVHPNDHESDPLPTPLTILELAAGPARHAATALIDDWPGLGRVQHVTAIDVSSIMRDYALAQEHWEDDADVTKFRYVVQDVRDPLPQPPSPPTTTGIVAGGYDTAWMLLGSLQHLLTTDDVLQCFRATHDALRTNGTFVLELPHPQEVFRVVECTRNSWTRPLYVDEEEYNDENDDDDDLQVIWGDEDDAFDPVRQIRNVTVEFHLRNCSDSQLRRYGMDGSQGAAPVLRQIVPTRLFTAPEIDALARCAGFRLHATYGALDPDVLVPFDCENDDDDDDLAYRMVCVLQKV